ncbi:OX-2 membrane glycoprotein-like isoform X2 [Rhinoderma darwinii]|uniref:OX-2 membrane glycoprotein-like isoform X2 n=1 Tax=Rhinoderma darwinii TaxID=43563 RepID=UPI003F675659
MEKTTLFIFLVWLLYCVTCDLDVLTIVDPVKYGERLTLKCILQQPNTAVQVTWTKVTKEKNTTVATYTSESGAEISKGYEDRLWMSTLGLNETAITIFKTGIQDEGCYECIFSFLPKGSKKKEVCLTIPGELLIEKHHRVGLFQPVTLKCIERKKQSEVKEVKQVSWQKNGENIATYEKDVYIVPKYEGIFNVTMEGRAESSLTLFRANISDEGTYSCLFNIFPGGAVTGSTTLQIYEPLNVTVSKNPVAGSLKLTCVARSWPPSKISWLNVDEGSLNGTTYDGFLTVTSWILISHPDRQQMKMPKCKALYSGEEFLFSLSAGTRCRLHSLIIILVVSKMFFL